MGRAIRGRQLTDAISYLQDVLQKKQGIPFYGKYSSGIGRKAQAKQFKVSGSKLRWPQKRLVACRLLLSRKEKESVRAGSVSRSLKVLAGAGTWMDRPCPA